MTKKENIKKLPSGYYDYLIKSGVDEQVALEIDTYTQEKEKRRRRIKNRKEEKWK